MYLYKYKYINGTALQYPQNIEVHIVILINDSDNIEFKDCFLHKNKKMNFFSFY